MSGFADLAGGFEPAALVGLLAASFLGSFITVAMGIGGGMLLLAIMASLLPPVALIPVHGAIQLGSNLLRAALLFRHIHWTPFAGFALGTVAGVATGGAVAINLSSGIVQIGVGAFVLWSVLLRPPRWLSSTAVITGTISSFLTMFFGATGVFVANFVKSLSLERRRHVATHAAFMTLQHLLKIGMFGLLGFGFAPWLVFILMTIGCGFLGTLAGRQVLNRMTDPGFGRALNIVLVLIALRLIWSGWRSLPSPF